MPKAETETARDRIVRTASELFYNHGFHAVGIDLIIERAGVAKATLYRHFSTKDDLISAYLEDADARFSEWFDASINPDERHPLAQRLLGACLRPLGLTAE